MAEYEVSRLSFNGDTYEIADELARQSVVTARTLIAEEVTRLDAVDTGLAGRITNLETSAGAVLVAKTKAARTDTSKIYVYTGSESGATAGHWYYHNGTAWTDGGVYSQNLDAIDVAPSSSSDNAHAAGAKYTYDSITSLNTDLGKLRQSVSDDYSSGSTYAVGDYCMHDGELYKCNTAISVSEVWTSAHWTKVDTMVELNNLKNATNVLMENTEVNIKNYDFLPFNLENARAWASSTIWKCVIIPVTDLSPQIKFASMGSRNLKFAFLKSGTPVAGEAPEYCTGYTVITVAPNNQLTVLVPSDCKYLYIYTSNWTDFTDFLIELYSFKECYSPKTPLSIAGIKLIALERGGFTDTGLNIDSNNRLRSIEHIPVTAGCTYKINVTSDNSLKISVSFYTNNDYTTERTSAIPWYTNIPLLIKIPDNVSYIRILIALTSDTNIYIYNVFSCTVEQISAAKNKNDYVITTSFLKQSLNVRQLGTLSLVQAFCKYNNKYYSTNGNYIAVQNSDFTVENTTELSLGHGNSLQLGSENIAYVSGWNDQKVYAVNLDTLSIVDTITLPTTGYTTAAVDDVNKLMYIFQRNDYPDTITNYNFIVYDYDNETIISTKKINAFSAMQSCDYYNGKIIVAWGAGTETMPSGMAVYNTVGDILSEYTLSIFANVEPEGVYFDRENKVLLVSRLDRKVYCVEYDN